MIQQLNFTTDDGVIHTWVNIEQFKQKYDNYIVYSDLRIYYATLEGILDAAKRYYIHKE